MVSERWIIEYSFEQDCFHIDPLDVVVEKNLRAISNGIVPSYIPIGYAASIEVASELAAIYRAALEQSKVSQL